MQLIQYKTELAILKYPSILSSSNVCREIEMSDLRLIRDKVLQSTTNVNSQQVAKDQIDNVIDNLYSFR